MSLRFLEACTHTAVRLSKELQDQPEHLSQLHWLHNVPVFECYSNVDRILNNLFERRGPFPFPQIPADIEFYYTANTVVSSVNVTLSAFLLITYIGIYRKTRSEFTIGLIIFSLVFLLNALASNPLVIWAFGYRPIGLGPFALLPDLFTFVALAVLLYLSLKY
jgi:hypothetical protein